MLNDTFLSTLVIFKGFIGPHGTSVNEGPPFLDSMKRTSRYPSWHCLKCMYAAALPYWLFTKLSRVIPYYICPHCYKEPITVHKPVFHKSFISLLFKCGKPSSLQLTYGNQLFATMSTYMLKFQMEILHRVQCAACLQFVLVIIFIPKM